VRRHWLPLTLALCVAVVATAADNTTRRKRTDYSRQPSSGNAGAQVWPELAPQQQKDALAQEKAYVRQVAEKYPALNMRLTETQHFLFLSDMPSQVSWLFTSCLDRMYDQLCNAFAVKDRVHVWLGGKAPVIVFSQAGDLAKFEQEFFKHKIDAGKFQGLSHQSSTGEVIISCHCGKDPYYFASVLVHEATHGFIHRYKSPERVPNWLNEGMAEWMAMNVVVNDHGVKGKVKEALLRIRQTGSLGGDFFTAEHLAPGQYGIATAMVEFLLRTNPRAFRTMIENIKSGEDWEIALKKSYRVTPGQLAEQFGRAVLGIPNLSP
jgi:hypothetical protein